MLPAGFTTAVSDGGQTLTISQVQRRLAVTCCGCADRTPRPGAYTVDAAGCDRPPGGGGREQPPVHGRLRGDRRRRRHRDRLAVDRRRRRHADGVGEPAGAARRRCADGWQSPAALATSIPIRPTPTGTLAHGYGADGAGTTLLTAAGAVLPAGFTAAVSNGGQTLTISQGATAVAPDPARPTRSRAAYTVDPAGCDRPPGGGDRGQPPVHGRLRGHRRRRRHRDRARCRSTSTTTRRRCRRTCWCQLDDDALAGGNAGGAWRRDPNAANTTGTLAHSYGADGAGTTLLTAAGAVLPAGFTAAVSNGGQTLTISQGATAVLR